MGTIETLGNGSEEISVLWQLVIYLGAFGIVAVAARKVAGVIQKLKLPLITGFLLIGLVSGPEVLGLIEEEALSKLNFVNEIALAFIAFAVGSELYLNELRSRMKSIINQSIVQIVIIFILVGLSVFLLMDVIPFSRGMRPVTRISVSMLAGIIAIASSPSSAIAIINELRARGSFTQSSIGVTVVKDFVVIVFFAIVFTLSKSLIQESDFRLIYIVQVLAELLLAFGLGMLVWLILRIILSIKGRIILKKALVLLTGLLVYLFTIVVEDHSGRFLGLALHIEPLLICIIGSLMIGNFSVYRIDFMKIIKDLGPYVYVLVLHPYR